MDSAKFGDRLQIIGTFGVIASLLFVALQLKQSHEIALATQYQSRSQAAMDFWIGEVQSGLASGPYYRHFNEEMTERDRRASYNRVQWRWQMLDNSHFQYQAGFIDDETWQVFQSWMQRQYGNCEWRFVYDYRRNLLRPSFIEFVESFDDPCESGD